MRASELQESQILLLAGICKETKHLCLSVQDGGLARGYHTRTGRTPAFLSSSANLGSHGSCVKDMGRGGSMK